MTNDFIIQLVNMLPFEEHLRIVKESIEEYEFEPSDEKKESVYVAAMMLSLKASAEKNGAAGLSKSLNDITRAVNFFNTPKN